MLVSRAEVMINRDSWGHSYLTVRGEILLGDSEEELGPCPEGSGEFPRGAWPMPLRYWKILRRSLAHAPQVLENSEEELGPCPSGIGKF